MCEVYYMCLSLIYLCAVVNKLFSLWGMLYTFYVRILVLQLFLHIITILTINVNMDPYWDNSIKSDVFKNTA
jgi:hypothetical protein